MRLLAVLLVMTLTGPSVGALVCELACATEHARVPAAGSCHEQGAPGSSATLAPPHVCHDLIAPEPSIAAGPQINPRVVAEMASPLIASAAAVLSHIVAAPHVATHAPPPKLNSPLRI
jgi:hypothetical protein